MDSSRTPNQKSPHSMRFTLLLTCIFLTACSPSARTLYTQKPALYSYAIGSVASTTPSHFHNPEAYVTVASCQKTLTALLAYKTLGSDYRFRTQLSITKKHGKVHDVILTFSGDPTLRSEDLLTLLHHVEGIPVTGRLFVDATRFRVPPYSPNIMRDDVGSAYAAPVSAMNLDHNLLNAKSSPSEMEPFIRDKLQALLTQIHLSTPIIFVKDASELPQDISLIATHVSKPLGDIIPPALKISDNLVFDSLYLTLLHAKSTKPLTKWEEGDPIIKALVAEHFGIDMGKALIADGSGLSRYNRIQTKTLFALLQKGYAVPTFVYAFPVPGEKDSTLAARMHLPSTIRAKTGSMSGISCLCGYNVTDTDATAFVTVASSFAPPLKEMYDVQDRFIAKVLQY